MHDIIDKQSVIAFWIVWEISKHFGKFLDTLKFFGLSGKSSLTLKLVGHSGNCPENLECFGTLWDVSI